MGDGISGPIERSWVRSLIRKTTTILHRLLDSFPYRAPVSQSLKEEEKKKTPLFYFIGALALALSW